jgi:hypothetical protein
LRSNGSLQLHCETSGDKRRRNTIDSHSEFIQGVKLG